MASLTRGSDIELRDSETSKLRTLVRRLGQNLARSFRPLVRERKTLPGVLSWTGIGILVAFIFIGITAPILVPEDQTKALAYPILLPPDSQHWMGTDGIGRDVFA